MAEQADAWASNGVNVWAMFPVVECSQSGRHGRPTLALQTAPSPIAGPAADDPYVVQTGRPADAVAVLLHVAARLLLPMRCRFGDHSDVMAVRQARCAMLCASSVQGSAGFALRCFASPPLQSRVPSLFIFGGLRTSHEFIQNPRWRMTYLRPAAAG